MLLKVIILSHKSVILHNQLFLYLPKLMVSFVTYLSSIGNSILCNWFYPCKVIVSIRRKSILSNWFYPCQIILSSPTYFIL